MADLYHHLHKKNEVNLEKLIVHGKNNDVLYVVKPLKKLSGDALVEAKLTKSVRYQKKTVETYNHGAADISIINADDDYHTTAWTTTPKKIKEALFSGIFDAGLMDDLSPIAKSIACYGKYRKIAAQRNIEREGLVSEIDVKKIAIVEFAQNALWSFRKLHECINNYNEGLTLKENVEKIKNTLNDLRNALLLQSFDYIKHPQISEGFTEILHDLEQFEKQFQMVTAQNFNEVALKDFLASSGGFCLNKFIKKQIETINATARKANNKISNLYNRGELFICIVDAENTHLKMNENPDYKNSFSPETCLDFGEETSTETLTINLKKFGAKIETDRELALQLDMLHQIEVYSTVKSGNKVEDLIGMHWSEFDWVNIPRSIARGIWDVITFFPDAVMAENQDGYPSQRWMPKAFAEFIADPVEKIYSAENPLSVIGKKVFTKEGNTRFTRINKSSLGSKIAPFIKTQLLRLTAEPLKEALYHAPKNFGKTLQRIYYDATQGDKVITDAEVLATIDRNLAFAMANKKISHQKMADYENEFQKSHADEKIILGNKNSQPIAEVKHQPPIGLIPDEKLAEKPEPKKRHAHLPYIMNRDKPNDVLSGASDGYQILFEVFLDEIYGKHPLGGMAFSAAAIAGGLPSIMPSIAKVAFMKSFMSHVSEPIALALVGETEGFMAGFSTALILGKVSFASLDFLKRGPNSILASFTKGAVENPVATSLIVAFAVGVGYLVAHDLNIPWLSNTVLEEAKGTFPAPELGLTGAKLAALIAEGLVDLSETAERDVSEAKLAALKEKIKAEITLTYDNHHKIDPTKLTAEQSVLREKTINDALAKCVEWMRNNHSLSQTFLQSSKMLQDTILRAKIAKLDTGILSEKEKHKILSWTQQNYSATDPDFVNSVREKLYKEDKSSPVATSIKIALSYLTAPFRAIYAGYKYITATDPKIKLAAKARLDEFKDKVRADVGLIVRGSVKAVKYTSKMFGVAVLSLIRIGVGAVCLGFAFFEMCVRTHPQSRSNDPVLSFGLFKMVDNGAKYIGSKIFDVFTDASERMVAWFRQSATPKSVESASKDITDKAILATPDVNNDTYKTLLKLKTTPVADEKAPVPAIRIEPVAVVSEAQHKATNEAFSEFMQIDFSVAESKAENPLDTKIKIFVEVQEIIKNKKPELYSQLPQLMDKIIECDLNGFHNEFELRKQLDGYSYPTKLFNSAESEKIKKMELVAQGYKKLTDAIYKLAPLVKEDTKLHEKLLCCLENKAEPLKIAKNLSLSKGVVA